MRITFVQPRSELTPYIESMWVLESSVGMPRTDQSMAAPNGCAKLIIPYENSITSIADGRVQLSREQGVYFVGNRDTSTIIQTTSQKTGFIAIEFSPFGAYAFWEYRWMNRPIDFSGRMRSLVSGAATSEKFCAISSKSPKRSTLSKSSWRRDCGKANAPPLWFSFVYRL